MIKKFYKIQKKLTVKNGFITLYIKVTKIEKNRKTIKYFNKNIRKYKVLRNYIT